MKPLSGDEIRESFLEFFEKNGHKRLPSSSLIPDDPTLLFTTAGMVQFKPYFLGKKEPPFDSATTVQKSFRTSDLENVGRTTRHHTFFEMLGNFSFGRYFKEGAITFAWQLITEVWKLPVDRLWVSIYEDDEEAYEIWNKKIGVPDSRIVRMGKDDNFWGPPGPTGPCGPCTEIHFDMGEDWPCEHPELGPASECERFREFWNLVFMQYHQDEEGNLHPLKRKGIDTGMGLERMASIMQGTISNFETDLFTPILDYLKDLTGKPYDPKGGEYTTAYRVVMDHIRALTFVIADGAYPSNEGRGYVVRRVIRRALRFGKKLGLEKPFLYDVVPVVVDRYKHVYPEIEEKMKITMSILKAEEENFFRTIGQGLNILENYVEQAKKEGRNFLTGKEAFKLYDTYGVPVDFIKDTLEEMGFTIKEKELEEELEKARERSRKSWKGGEKELIDNELKKALPDNFSSTFVGYEKEEEDTRIMAILKDGKAIEKSDEGEEISLVLEKTPFYAESGGQIPDHGYVETETGKIEVYDVQKHLDGKVFLHTGKVIKGSIRVGQEAHAEIDHERRAAIRRAHTGTHIMYKVMRDVLGNHVSQAGSMVGPDYIRFDFTHFEALKPEEKKEIEKRVMEAILANMPVTVHHMTLEEALSRGAVAEFMDKYQEKVRVVEIGNGWTLDLCGGTHASATGDIGILKIIYEGSVSTGVRRIEAYTGMKALERYQELEDTVTTLARKLSTSPDRIDEMIDKMKTELKETQKELEKTKEKLTIAMIPAIDAEGEMVGDVYMLAKVLSDVNADDLRMISDQIRSRHEKAVVILGGIKDNRPIMIAAATKNLTDKLHMGNIVREAAKVMKGGGGGRPDMAQAGGKDASKLSAAVMQAADMVKKALQE